MTEIANNPEQIIVAYQKAVANNDIVKLTVGNIIKLSMDIESLTQHGDILTITTKTNTKNINCSNVKYSIKPTKYKTKCPCMNLWYKNTKIATDVENEPGKCISILRDLDYITSEEIIQIMDAILNNATIVLNDWVLCIDAEYAINNDYDPYDFVDGNCHSDDSCVDCKAAEFCSFKHTGKNNL